MPDVKTSQRSITLSVEKRGEQSPIALFGAILLSAVGSLPLHLIPLTIVALIADGRVSIAEAGLVASAILLGLVLSSLTLPVLKVSIVPRMSALAAVILLILGLATTLLAGLTSLYLGWCLVGISCGVLMYIGTSSASHYGRTTLAFSLRLGVVMILAGSIAGSLLMSNALASYQSFLTVLFLMFSFISVAGLLLYSPVVLDIKLTTYDQKHRWQAPQATGLLTIYVLFVGQAGFFAYVVQGALDRGMTFAASIAAMATMKVLAGVLLVGVAKLAGRRELRDRFLEIGILLATGVAIASHTRDITSFFLGLLIIEIAFNTLSARLQARVAETNRLFAGQWITATMLLGAACGAPLHGAAISADLSFYFLLLAMGSAILPAIWARAYTT